jgi:hypothetical protein
MKPLLLVAAICLAACVPEPEIGALDPNPGGGGAPEKLSTITTNIFVPKCATSGCHAGHPPPSAPGSYEPEFVWGDTVLVPSLQASGMNVVEPRTATSCTSSAGPPETWAGPRPPCRSATCFSPIVR